MRFPALSSVAPSGCAFRPYPRLPRPDAPSGSAPFASPGCPSRRPAHRLWLPAHRLPASAYRPPGPCVPVPASTLVNKPCPATKVPVQPAEKPRTTGTPGINRRGSRSVPRDFQRSLPAKTPAQAHNFVRSYPGQQPATPASSQTQPYQPRDSPPGSLSGRFKYP